jgi:cell division transport system ATP-binding protein
MEDMENNKMLIEYKDVYINQQEQPILKDVNLQVYEKDFIFLYGRVGTGKSTLLKSFYYEVPILSGEGKILEYNLRAMKQRHIPHLRRSLGIVFQDFKLLIDRNVYENLKFVLHATGQHSKAEMEVRINEVLKYVGMPNKGYKMPHELSGGEQQRIVMARALLNNPRILLADEPTGNLDYETGNALVQLLHRISQEGTAVVMATHNPLWAKMYPGRIIRCEDYRLIEETPFTDDISNEESFTGE